MYSEDGSVSHYDLRASDRRPTATFTPKDTEQTDVQYHPQSDKLFLTSDTQGLVRLRDARMAFTSKRGSSVGGIVMKVSATNLHQLLEVSFLLMKKACST